MYAKCRNEMYVEMCPEAYEEDGDKKCCWRLEKAMYGTRSAAQDWQHEIKRRMLSNGYLQGKVEPVLVFTTLLQRLHVWYTVTTSWPQVKNQH